MQRFALTRGTAKNSQRTENLFGFKFNLSRPTLSTSTEALWGGCGQVSRSLSYFRRHKSKRVSPICYWSHIFFAHSRGQFLHSLSWRSSDNHLYLFPSRCILYSSMHLRHPVLRKWRNDLDLNRSHIHHTHERERLAEQNCHKQRIFHHLFWRK